MTYGLMPEHDYRTMDKTLELVHQSFPSGIINTLEIGVHKGNTSRGIRDFFKEKGRINFHTGIDNQHDFEMGSPFPECNFLIGNSMTLYNKIRDQSQHFLLIDGCHNLPMTIIDFLMYAPKVAINGYLAFHDTGLHIKPFTDYQGMGDKNDPDMFISCRKALEKLGLLNASQIEATTYPNTNKGQNGWFPVFDEADANFHTGGITVFKRVNGYRLSVNI